MQVVAEHFDAICYGGVGRSEMRNMIEDGTYTSVESPMAYWRKSSLLASALPNLPEAISTENKLQLLLLNSRNFSRTRPKERKRARCWRGR